MAVHASSVSSTTILSNAIGAAETVICICPPLNLPLDGAAVMLWWFIEFLVGTGGVNSTIRLRRGSVVSSPLINVGNAANASAGTTVRFSGVYTDLPGIVAGQQYSLTLQVGSASTASAVNDVCLVALAL